MSRLDLTDYLVHWVGRGESQEEAFERLNKIVQEGRLLGGIRDRKGQHITICFSESPPELFHKIRGRYNLFGVQLPKLWAFTKGGRPAIYGRDEEYEDLPETHQWRHVRYEPDNSDFRDFTWEREWRILTEELELPRDSTVIVVPDERWGNELEERHQQREWDRIREEALLVPGYELQEPTPFPYQWKVFDSGDSC